MSVLQNLKDNSPLKNADSLIAIVRIITGLLMAYHGLEVFDSTKMSEYAGWDSYNGLNGSFMAYLGKGSELIGGILLTLGLFTRLGSIIMIGCMTYITFFVGKGKFWYEDQHPFMFVLLGIVFLALGGGKWCIDTKK